jgi:2-oxoglutarate dehydrogenase E2 component (dihydrolipoamide succinyltransferase)
MAIAELIMPKMGESIMEATILRWHKQVGDRIALDETVLDIATDKVDSEVPSTVEGTIKELLFKVDDVVPIGAVIARIETEAAAETIAKLTTPEPILAEDKPLQQESPAVTTEDIEVPYTPQPATFAKSGSNNRFYSPLVLNIANSEGISLSELERIPGTGAEGRVSKKDVLQYIAAKKEGKAVLLPADTLPVFAHTPSVQPQQKTIEVAAKHIPVVIDTKLPTTPAYEAADSMGRFSDPARVVLTGNTEIIEMDRMRKLIAKHMVDSVHTSPHVTSFSEADVTNMVLWREKVKHDFEKREGTKLTFTPMFVECVVNVMKRFPLINCSLDGDKIVIKKDINIGMATALPSGNLIVPVIKGADQLNIVGLSKAVNGLANAARNNKLKPDDTVGGTFTLTNVGTFGSLMGTPIINQPQVAILAVGAIKKRAVVIERKDGDTIGIRHMMYLSLSYDHRIVDGSLGASFLSEVAKEFEKWDINRQWFQYV